MFKTLNHYGENDFQSKFMKIQIIGYENRKDGYFTNSYISY